MCNSLSAQSTADDLPILDTAYSLLLQYIRLCNVCQISHSKEERAVALVCLKTICSNINIIYNQVYLKFKMWPGSLSGTLDRKSELLTSQQKQLWWQLSFPHETQVRFLIYKVILTLESLVLLLSGKTIPQYCSPTKTNNQPSVLDQVIFRPVSIIDPYLLAIKSNYYYPLLPEPIMTEEPHQPETLTSDEDPSMQIDGKPAAKSPPRAKTISPEVITVEHSLEVITELIKEIESDDEPVESQQEGTNDCDTVPAKASSYRHRFALYRKKHISNRRCLKLIYSSPSPRA